MSETPAHDEPAPEESPAPQDSAADETPSTPVDSGGESAAGASDSPEIPETSDSPPAGETDKPPAPAGRKRPAGLTITENSWTRRR